jgi:hypothetical protein
VSTSSETDTSAVTRIRPTRERRKYARRNDHDVDIVDQSLRSTADQLLEARESLKAARRRVVQLEDAVEFWQELRRRVVTPPADRASTPRAS